MVRNLTLEARFILRDRYPVRFKELKARVKKNYPFTGEPTYANVTRYNSQIYNLALKALAFEHDDEFIIEMRKFNPNYKKRLKRKGEVKVIIYEGEIAVSSKNMDTQVFKSSSDATKYVSALIRELNK